MKAKPIIFSVPMVRALLEGRKTQTRRVITPRNSYFNGHHWHREILKQAWNWAEAWVDPRPSPAGNAGPYLKLPWLSGDDPDTWEGTVHRIYPRYAPGDRLWVRETWGDLTADHPLAIDGRKPTIGDRLVFRANPADVAQWVPGHRGSGSFCWRSPIHMPRWASRLTLDVTNVRVQRVQEISEGDAVTEGFGKPARYPDSHYCRWDSDPLDEFYEFWNTLQKPGRQWADNPWVVALTFTVHNGNIDTLGRAA